MSAHLPDELLAAHLDGTLPAAEREAADAHLDVCARCREELELAAGAREALRALPRELLPPTDLAALVARPPHEPAAGSAGSAAGAEAGPPRWYRAAAVAAVAAAIGLAAVIVPNLGGREQGERAGIAGSAATQAPEAASTSGSETKGAGSQSHSLDAAASSRGVERSQRDFDLASLRELATASTPVSFEGAATLAGSEAEEVVACVREAAGDTIPADARPVRLIVATFRGTPADIAVFAVGSDEDRRVQVVVATRDCRLLAVSASG